MNKAVLSEETRSLDGIEYTLLRKKVKTLRINVRSPYGEVVVTAPYRMPLSRIERFISEKSGWINKVRKKFSEKSDQEKMALSYVSGDILSVWGEEYELIVREEKELKRGRIEAGNGLMLMRVPEGFGRDEKEKLADSFYKKILEEEAEPVLRDWEEKTGLYFDTWHTRKMKSRWGSCVTSKKRICLNTRLAEKPRECLVYVALHEIAHLKEANHGPRFKLILDAYMPGWRAVEKLLK